MNSPDMVRVHLCEDDDTGVFDFNTLPPSHWSENDVYDVPAEQLAKWQAASDAWEAAQEEMQELMDGRAAERRDVEAERVRRKAEWQVRQEKRRTEVRRDLYSWAEEERRAYTAARTAAVQWLRSEPPRATTSLALTILDRPSPFDLPAPMVRVAPGTCRQASFGWIHVRPSCCCPRDRRQQ